MRTVRVLIDYDNWIFARISGKRINRIKSININIQKDGVNTFEIITEKETFNGEIVGKSLQFGGSIK